LARTFRNPKGDGFRTVLSGAIHLVYVSRNARWKTNRTTTRNTRRCESADEVLLRHITYMVTSMSPAFEVRILMSKGWVLERTSLTPEVKSQLILACTAGEQILAPFVNDLGHVQWKSQQRPKHFCRIHPDENQRDRKADSLRNERRL